MTDFRRPALLDPQRHDRRRFDCGKPVLDDWLRRYAGQSRRSHTAATWVIVDAADIVVAYASISMSAIDLSAAPPRVAKRAPDPVPALLLGRLAVDRHQTGRGIGTALVAHVLATAAELDAQVACRAVVVTSLNTSVRGWWERMGFALLDPDDKQCLDLYLVTADIDATLQAIR